jgi:uncharacterized protein with FMN-binding domain
LNKKKKRSGNLRAILVVLAILLVAGGGFAAVRYAEAAREAEAVRNMEIRDMDLSSMHDGTYHGAFTYGGFTYEVEVTIRNYTITDIEIESNRKTKYAKMAEGVVQNVLTRGNTAADVVSGATTTSKALLKAIEQAIECNL